MGNRIEFERGNPFFDMRAQHGQHICSQTTGCFDLVEGVSAFIGAGGLRFILTYTPEDPNESFGQLLVTVDDFKNIPRIASEIQRYTDEMMPFSEVRFEKFRLGPGEPGKIQARISGPNGDVLRNISSKIEDIMQGNPDVINLRNDWRSKVKIIQPVLFEENARNLSLTRKDISQSLQTNFTGSPVGLYREKDVLLPIIMRPRYEDRSDVNNLWNITLWSPAAKSQVPLSNIVSSIETVWSDSIIRRRNQMRTLTVLADPKPGLTANQVLNQIRPDIEAIPLPVGYSLEWGGEYEKTSEAQAGLKNTLILSFIGMMLIMIILFNSIRKTLIIVICLPLAIIGVTLALLPTGLPFGFMALLGFISLAGMLIKNAIVLIDQIDLDQQAGKTPYDAIISAGVSRLRPISMAALTTVLGMIPLLGDVFFQDMAVTIMGGLTFATVLTLIFVPVLYVIFFRVKVP